MTKCDITLYCNICNKYYKNKNSFGNHKRKFHILQSNKEHFESNKEHFESNKEHFESNKEHFESNKLICKYCNKIYKHYQSKNRHIKKCKEKHDNILKQECEKLKKENEELKLNFQNQMNEIKNHVKELINENCKIHPKTLQKINNTIGNITQNNTQNNIKEQNNNFNLMGFDKMILENIFSKKEQLKILKQTYNCLPFLINYAHFNDNYPQLKNIKITSLHKDIAYKYNEKKQKFIALSKDQLVNELIYNRMIDIEEFKSCLYDKLKPKEQKIINNLLDQFYEDEIKYTDKYRLDIKFMIYNNSDNIIK